METLFVKMEHCIGCRQCEFACAVEHSKSRDPMRAVFEEPLPKPRLFVEAGPWLGSSLPNHCHHCDPASCESVCPTGAIRRDARHGVVLADAGRCIACAMCAMVCPFDVISFHPYANGGPARVVAVKCDGCVERREREERPACVEACKTGALQFGEVNQLVARDRRERSREALVEGREPSAERQTPDTVASWRGWGQAATHVAEGVSHGNAPTR